MELVYLWVDNYKNIRNQGFNFSPRFECKFDGQKLTICDKKKNKCKNNDYIENFYGVNINVTAIVGKNGSGKSSVLEILAEIFRIEFNKNKNLIVDNTHSFDFFLTFKIKDKTYEIKSIDKHDTNTFSNDKEIENILDYYVYSNDIDIENKFLFDNTSIAQMLVYDYSQNKNFKLSSFMYLPIKIEIRLSDFEKKFEKLIRNNKLYPMYRNEPDSVYIQNASDEQQTQIRSFESINNDKYHQFLILKLLENNEETHSFDLTKEEIQKKLKIQNIEFISEDDFKQYFKISEEIFQKFEKEVIKLESKEKEVYINKYSDFFEFDFIDEQNRRYSDLSHGEKTLFGQLLNIYYNSEKSKNDNLLFLFDEPELSLHPQWQKNYINEIYNLIVKIGKNYHFIFTSHSPFILSDIPKENVIFLEKYKKNEDKNQEEGNCKNVTKDIQLETFGANIHTLLSHGFFMSDGLMGEFAKVKITEILELLNNEEKLKSIKKKQIKSIIKSIGEDFLRNKLLNLYYKKFNTDKQQRIKELKNELKRLEKMIEIKLNNSYLNGKNGFLESLESSVKKDIVKLIKEGQLVGNKKERKSKEKKDTQKYVYTKDPKGNEKKQLIKCKLVDIKKEKEFLKYLKDNLKKIIESKPKELKKIIETLYIKYPEIKNKTSNVYKIIYYIFVDKGYEAKISTTSDISIAYKLVENLGIKTCPYCNRSYISFIKNDEKKTRPQLDHFYPKAIYPFLACSFYNLIPSCSACNHMKSDNDSYNDEKDGNLVHPYNVKDSDFTFSYTFDNLDILKSIDKENIRFEDEQKIKITLDRKYEKNNDYFQLETIYQNHRDIVIELILKEINYPKSYIDELINNGFGTEEEIYRFIFSNYLKTDDLHKRPLSKLTKDIVEELGILEKIRLIVEENK